MISIIIPAHNEENVIVRCLTPLLPGTKKKEFEIIVICNGCTDKTPRIVESFETVQLIETELPSKTNALNLGDETASGFPRFYIDADIVISLDAVRKVAHVLDSDRFLVAAPQVKMNFNYSSWFVKSYYDIWLNLSYIKEGLIGTGVYAVSQNGRARFKKFPDVVADDAYFRALYTDQEKYSVPDCYSEVTAPATINDLLKIKKRSRLGLYELWKKFPQLTSGIQKDTNYGIAIIELMQNIRLWHKIPVYLFVNILSRVKAGRHFTTHGATGWERDLTNRKIL
ncbi:MAG: glycosyltransferase [Candidatus Electrothrix sp. AX2]|nr:glycosyltransferase [Candidatus Electrothrix gigas]